MRRRRRRRGGPTLLTSLEKEAGSEKHTHTLILIFINAFINKCISPEKRRRGDEEAEEDPERREKKNATFCPNLEDQKGGWSFQTPPSCLQPPASPWHMAPIKSKRYRRCGLTPIQWSRAHQDTDAQLLISPGPVPIIWTLDVTAAPLLEEDDVHVISVGFSPGIIRHCEEVAVGGGRWQGQKGQKERKKERKKERIKNKSRQLKCK